jgi:hypothetical protein
MDRPIGAEARRIEMEQPETVTSGGCGPEFFDDAGRRATGKAQITDEKDVHQVILGQQRPV